MVRKIICNSTFWILVLFAALSLTAYAGSPKADFGLFRLKNDSSSYIYSDTASKTDAEESSGYCATVVVQGGDYISKGINMHVLNTKTGKVDSETIKVTKVKTYAINYSGTPTNTGKKLGGRKAGEFTQVMNVHGKWYP